MWVYKHLQVNRTFRMPRVAFLSSFLFHLKLLLPNFCGVHQEEKLLLPLLLLPLLSMTVRLIQSRSRLAARAKGVRFRLLECSSAARLLPCTVLCVLLLLVLPAWQPLCCAAFEFPTKEKLLHCLQALTTYGLQLVMHLTCTHSLTYTHTYICMYVCKQLHTHSQLKRSLATAAATAAAACLMSKLVPGLTRRMRNMPLPSCVGFMNSPALLAEGANNSLRNQRSLNAKLFPVAAAANVAACHTGHTCHGNTH